MLDIIASDNEEPDTLYIGVKRKLRDLKEIDASSPQPKLQVHHIRFSWKFGTE